MNKKAQYSMEYLLTFTVIFASLIPIAYLIYQWVTPHSCNVVENQIEYFEHRIVDAAEEECDYGAPSKTTLYLQLPEGVVNISTISNFSVPPGTNITTQKYLLIVYKCNGKTHKKITKSRVPLNFSNYNVYKKFFSSTYRIQIQAKEGLYDKKEILFADIRFIRK